MGIQIFSERQEVVNNGIAKLLCDGKINQNLSIESFSEAELASLKTKVDAALDEQTDDSSLTKRSISNIIDEIEFFGKNNPNSTIGSLYIKLLKKAG